MASTHTDLLTKHDRVRQHTAREANERIDRETAERVREYASRPTEDLDRRIAELEAEWDIERVLEANASALAFAGLSLGHLVSRRWLLLPAVVLPFLFQHAVQGWCPPMLWFRRVPVRTRREIEVESNALKALRGDYEGLPPRDSDALARATQALAAARK